MAPLRLIRSCEGIPTVSGGIPELIIWPDIHVPIQSVVMIVCTKSHEIRGLGVTDVVGVNVII